jgi:ferredoxin
MSSRLPAGAQRDGRGHRLEDAAMSSPVPPDVRRAGRGRRSGDAAAGSRLRVNPIACTGHGLCAELLPELISLDEWGYPVLAGQWVPAGLERQARSAVASCPALALLLSPAG